MWSKALNIFRTHDPSKKRGFGIMEVLVSALVLGFLYMALNQLQKSNDEGVHRIRCRDGAVEVAQEVLDSLKAVGSAAIPSESTKNDTIMLDLRTRQWARSLGGTTTVKYYPVLVVSKTDDYKAESKSNYETIDHIYAKQVEIIVAYLFKNTEQTVRVSGVIR